MDEGWYREGRNRDIEKGWQEVRRRKRMSEGNYKQQMDIAHNTFDSKKVYNDQISYYITNFPEYVNAKDIFNIFGCYGKLVKVLIHQGGTIWERGSVLHALSKYQDQKYLQRCWIMFLPDREYPC